LPIPASCSVSLKSRKLSLAYAAEPGYCVAWKGGAGFDECSYSALLKADCPTAGERCCIQILCAPTGYCLNANRICEGGESSPNPTCDGGPEKMNCCVLRLPSKPSGECEDDLPSLCKHFPDNECCKSPDDTPSDYPIFGPGGPGVIFNQPQQDSFPEPPQDGGSLDRGWEGSNSNTELNVPSIFTCSSLAESLGLC